MPKWLRVLGCRIRGIFGRRRLDEDFQQELDAHLEMLTEENIRRGMPPEEARRAARVRLGGLTQLRESNREMWGFPWLETLLQDLRYSHRQLRRNPGFAAVAVLTLALGIGATTAIYSVANDLFLRGMPARRPGQLIGLSFHQVGNLGNHNFSYPDFEDIRKQASCFSKMFAYRIGLEGLKHRGQADEIIATFVTGNYFTALGLRPALGRLILPSEGAIPGSDPVVVLGYSYWQRRFSGDTGVIGKQVEVDGHAVTVVGVAPKGFRGLYGAAIDVQAYLPMNMFSVEGRDRGWANDRTSHSLCVMGRLKPGVTVDRAQAVLDVIAGRLDRQYPRDWARTAIGTYPAEAANVLFNPSRNSYRVAQVATGLFLGMAGLVLLLACFNVANVLLVRATAREHEMAVRAALGASRSRIIRQVLSESLVLAFLGAAGGLALGSIASRALSAIHLRVGVPVRLDFTFDWRVYAFTSVCAFLAGLVVGTVPAFRASQADPGNTLHGGGRGVAAGRHFLRNLLVVAQLAGSMVLLIVAGLFVSSLQRASRVDLGFNPRHILNMSMDPGDVGYGHERGREFYREVLARCRALPGVRAASLAESCPGSEYFNEDRVYVEGHLPPVGRKGPKVFDNRVSPGYFKTMDIPIVGGRAFQETDSESAPLVAIINQTMARKFWPGEDPLGKRFRTWRSSDSNTWIQVVGVARDSRVVDLTAAVPPYFYLPLDQSYSQLVTLQVRTMGPPENMVRELKQHIQTLAPGLPLFGIQTMDQALNGPRGFFHYWLGSALATVLGVLGLLLASVGVYGVISFTASQRTHEIGIRMALGAERRDVLTMVIGQGLKLALIGIGIGVVGAFILTRFLSSLLYGVKPTDPLTFIAVSLILIAVALLACYIPARRAAKVDPMVALRYE